MVSHFLVHFSICAPPYKPPQMLIIQSCCVFFPDFRYGVHVAIIHQPDDTLSQAGLGDLSSKWILMEIRNLNLIDYDNIRLFS